MNIITIPRAGGRGPPRRAQAGRLAEWHGRQGPRVVIDCVMFHYTTLCYIILSNIALVN